MPSSLLFRHREDTDYITMVEGELLETSLKNNITGKAMTFLLLSNRTVPSSPE
jgi:hypothetical protein